MHHERWTGGRIPIVLVAMAALAGCPRAELVECEDGTFCARDRICLVGGGCAEPDQVDACAGLDENAACVWPGVGDGSCRGGACAIARCGDHVVDAAFGELCDDGNLEAGDGCTPDCRSIEICGNGYLDFVGGEQCDDGNLEAGDGDGCQSTCLLPRCGDLVIDSAEGEVCDDGNRVDGAGAGAEFVPDGCSRDCLSDQTCGNGIRDLGEECDDGNTIDHDGCQSSLAAGCVVQRCGDNIVDGPAEACDDGNPDNHDDCTDTCEVAICGDGYLRFENDDPDDPGSEECDDGDFDDSDACPGSCRPAVCGDGYVYSGYEECDAVLDDPPCTFLCVCQMHSPSGACASLP